LDVSENCIQNIMLYDVRIREVTIKEYGIRMKNAEFR